MSTPPNPYGPPQGHWQEPPQPPPGSAQPPPGPWPGPPPDPWQGPPPPGPWAPPPKKRNKRAAVIIAIAVPAAVALLITFAALAPHTAAPTGPWHAGQCVTPAGRIGDQEGKAFKRTGCDASDADAKVTKMTSTGITGMEPTDCPEDTDAMVRVEQPGHVNLTANVACIRNIAAPHPGDVGQGGGMFRAGDCILDPDAASRLREVPCSATHWGTVVRWADSAQACPQGGDYGAVRTLGGTRALCVRKGAV
jgi:hypothetical protein